MAAAADRGVRKQVPISALGADAQDPRHDQRSRDRADGHACATPARLDWTIADGTTMLVGMHSLETARAGEAATEEERKAVRGRRVLVFVSAKVKAVE